MRPGVGGAVFHSVPAGSATESGAARWRGSARDRRASPGCRRARGRPRSRARCRRDKNHRARHGQDDREFRRAPGGCSLAPCRGGLPSIRNVSANPGTSLSSRLRIRDVERESGARPRRLRAPADGCGQQLGDRQPPALSLGGLEREHPARDRRRHRERRERPARRDRDHGQPRDSARASRVRRRHPPPSGRALSPMARARPRSHRRRDGSCADRRPQSLPPSPPWLRARCRLRPAPHALLRRRRNAVRRRRRGGGRRLAVHQIKAPCPGSTLVVAP